jgi:hypothetical protein
MDTGLICRFPAFLRKILDTYEGGNLVVLDAIIGKDSLSMQIDDPFHIDLDDMVGKIVEFAASKGIPAGDLDLKGLITKMIKGIAGCENGCPADAKGFVSRGFDRFELQYIEGGILSARASTGSDAFLYLKMFPDF